MRPDYSTHTYSRVAIILHWVMALGIAALTAMGLVMTHLKLEPMRLFQMYQMHKSIGITVLLAAFLRLASLDDKAQAEALLKLVHAHGAYALIALVAVHTAAALRHHFITRDDVLSRMLPHVRRMQVVATQTKEHSS
jgi:cytochrome b561